MRVFVGHSTNEAAATDIAERSLATGARQFPFITERISRQSLGGAYTRPTEIRDGHLWDVLSSAAMSTDHAIARFFVPWLCGYSGWALFVDGDVLFRRPVEDLFALADDRYAVMCVQHPELSDTTTKKLGDRQQAYTRKNWSSVMLIHCGHVANTRLTLERCNTLPGRALHRFDWLMDDEIGALPPAWNYLVGVNPVIVDPAIAHFTLGTPDQRTYNEKYVDPALVAEWQAYAATPQGITALG